MTYGLKVACGLKVDGSIKDSESCLVSIDLSRKKWQLNVMNRKHTIKSQMKDHRNDDYVPGTPEDRIGLVWPLTREAASLSVKHDAERRLQRHVTCLKASGRTKDLADAEALESLKNSE